MSWSANTARALALAALVRPAPVVGQSVRAQFGIGGSVALPTSFYHADPAGDGFIPALHALALVDLKLPKSPIGFRLDASTGHNAAHMSRCCVVSNSATQRPYHACASDGSSLVAQ